MNRFIKYIIVVLLLPVLFSCDQTEIEEIENGVPLTFSNLSFEEIYTRSTLTQGALGAFRLANSNYTSAISNVQYNYVTSWIAPVTPVYLNKNQATLNFYYPYNATYTNSNAIPMTSQVPGINQSNALWYSRVTASSTDLPLNLSLKQAYARITFNLTHLASYTGTCAVSNITISNPDIISTATLNIEDTDGYPYTPIAKGSVSFNPNISSIAVGASDATGMVLMVPVASLSGDISFSFTVDGKERTGILTAGSLTSLSAAGNYQINVNIERVGLTVTTDVFSGTMKGSLVTETSNCYMVAPGKSITIPVNIKGNGTSSTIEDGISVTHIATSVGIIWSVDQSGNVNQTNIVEISSFNSAAQLMTITASQNTGNVLVAAYNGTKIVWSWHIWVTNYDPYKAGTITHINQIGNKSYGTYTMMDRNLGALTTSFQGNQNDLHYQFGRKDPFPGNGYSIPPVIIFSGLTQLTMKQSIEYPTYYLYNSGDWCSTKSNDWWWGVGGSANDPTQKTIYDPCPPGWRVPWYTSSPYNDIGQSPFNRFVTSYGTWQNNGMDFTANGSGFYPAAGYRAYNGQIANVGTYGSYWTSAPVVSPIFQSANTLGFNNEGSSINTDNRAIAVSVRCAKY